MDEAKKIIEEMLAKMSFQNFSIETTFEEGGAVLNITLDSPGPLIGEYGMNLRAFEHMAKLILKSKNIEAPVFIIDVNSYRKERNHYLRDLANKIADKVILEQRQISLPPLSAYERRIIHTELSKRLNVSTESEGEGDERKVVVKPLSV